MNPYFFKGVLQESGWIDNTKITVGDSGVIQAIESFEEGETSGDMLGYALPGFQNAHSHAFQYAMAGIAEQHASLLILMISGDGAKLCIISRLV